MCALMVNLSNCFTKRPIKQDNVFELHRILSDCKVSPHDKINKDLLLC